MLSLVKTIHTGKIEDLRTIAWFVSNQDGHVTDIGEQTVAFNDAHCSDLYSDYIVPSLIDTLYDSHINSRRTLQFPLPHCLLVFRTRDLLDPSEYHRADIPDVALLHYDRLVRGCHTTFQLQVHHW